MYKVFINDIPIIITDSLKNDNNFSTVILEDIIMDEIFYKIKSKELQGINLFVDDIHKGWKKFQRKFKLIKAAGGLVVNKKNELLFIYRAKKWDLPKGRIEKGEKTRVAAIREVEEECGISKLKIERSLLKTYHIFYQDKKMCLKKTNWYLMSTTFKGKLTPQREEGITKAVFKNNEEVEKIIKKTYANILLVYNTYKNV